MFKHKYLKYKLKYQNLKRMIGAGYHEDLEAIEAVDSRESAIEYLDKLISSPTTEKGNLPLFKTNKRLLQSSSLELETFKKAEITRINLHHKRSDSAPRVASSGRSGSALGTSSVVPPVVPPVVLSVSTLGGSGSASAAVGSSSTTNEFVSAPLHKEPQHYVLDSRFVPSQEYMTAVISKYTELKAKTPSKNAEYTTSFHNEINIWDEYVKVSKLKKTQLEANVSSLNSNIQRMSSELEVIKNELEVKKREVQVNSSEYLRANTTDIPRVRSEGDKLKDKVKELTSTIKVLEKSLDETRTNFIAHSEQLRVLGEQIILYDRQFRELKLTFRE
jgi:hypothetical protein